MSFRFAAAGTLAVVLVCSLAIDHANAGEPPAAGSAATSQAATAPARPMSPARVAWMKQRCAQLVAFFDYYGVSRGENSDGPRNHTRIGAALECQQGDLRAGKRTMEALLVNKAFAAPPPSLPEVEPEDIEAPDLTLPTRAER